MTRRERHLHIIDSFGLDNRARRALDRLIAGKGLAVLSDDGVEQLTRLLLADLATAKRYNALNRKLGSSS
jgi:hypothetical protein